MIATACPHEKDVRDCHDCLAAAHEKAIERAENGVGRIAMLFGPAVAMRTVLDAEAARRGFRLLRKSGIPAELPAEDWRDVCRVCGVKGASEHVVCRNPECQGRRVRFQPPEVPR